MTKPSTEKSPQETAKILMEIEKKSRLEFVKDPGKAFELLDEFHKEHKNNPEIKQKIEALIKELGEKLGLLREQEKKLAEKKPEPKLTGDERPKTPEEKLKESREKVDDALKEIAKKPGNEIDEKAGVMRIQDPEDVKKVAAHLREVYDHFAELGFDVHKKKTKQGAEFFAIEFPDSYKGNRDVLTK
ncbi:MAG: hypothetical protein FJX34_01980 [Alphaproteobacteria bacterium]|nr:hypothetical protein [Alphaproteobacteria bacterium]